MKLQYLACAPLLLWFSTANGQALKIDKIRMFPDPSTPGYSSLVWASGKSETKNKHIIFFEEQLKNDTVMIGYQYRKTSMDSLEVNDVLLFFIPKLKYSSSWSGLRQVSYDEKDKRVLGVSELNGAWKELTILKKYQVKNNLVIICSELCVLVDQTEINTLTLRPYKDFYVLEKTSLTRE